MQRLGAVFTMICILLCCTFNYTFPLYNEFSTSLSDKGNQTKKCDKVDHQMNFMERTKKMANNIESTFKKLVDSTQDIGRNIYDHLNTPGKCGEEKHSLSGEDLKQYEQLVIMKKYPYLDLKELELKFSPSGKNVRQNIRFETGPNLSGDSGICEPLEDGLNVEIINRGLSGFAIPSALTKSSNVVLDNKINLNNLKTKNEVSTKTNLGIVKKSAQQNEFKNLKDDIIKFEERMKINNFV